MSTRPVLTLVPDLGDLLRHHPQYNAGTVVELLRHLKAPEVLWASNTEPDHPLRDALPTVGIAIRAELWPDWSWAEAEYQQLQGFLRQYPQGCERLQQAQMAQQELAGLLLSPLTVHQVLSAELLDATQRFHRRTAELLDEGPGTRWRAKRLAQLADGLGDQAGVAIVALDDLPPLLERLPQAGLPELEGFKAGESSRLRALADRAWRLTEDDDLNALLDALNREDGDAVTPKAELEAVAAQIYLAVGEVEAARQLLERAAHRLDDRHPRSLAGLILVRLGQMRDALGERELAQRTYRAVLALSYAPQVARAAAEAGLQRAFALTHRCVTSPP